jgi:hypothetical protein
MKKKEVKNIEHEIDNMLEKKKGEVIIEMNENNIENNIEKEIISTDLNEVPKDITIADLDMKTIQTQTALDKAFTELFNEVSLEKKTEFLKTDEIKRLGTLYTMAKHYGFIALQERIVKHMQMRISLKRKGRVEAVDMFKYEREREEQSALEKYTRQD